MRRVSSSGIGHIAETQHADAPTVVATLHSNRLLNEKSQALGCELLGLSIDSTYAHIAWDRNIEEKFGVRVPFPIIEDLPMKVASAYGMIQPGADDTSAVRAIFVIDPKGILCARGDQGGRSGVIRCGLEHVAAVDTERFAAGL